MRPAAPDPPRASDSPSVSGCEGGAARGPGCGAGVAVQHLEVRRLFHVAERPGFTRGKSVL
eukprot:13704420-Alexandrium_andersonii.AAC.1